MNGIRAVLKRLHSPDVADFEAFAPRDPRCFSVLVQAMFGPEGTAGEESFDVVVCTPKWLEREAEIKGIAYPRHHLVVNDFDIERLRAFLDGYARQCVGETWQEVAVKLARLGRWEFDDYVP